MNDNNVTCKDCTFWVSDKNGLGLQGEILMQKVGTCVCMPPTPVIVNQAGNVGFVAIYPKVPDNYPACGEFEERD